MRKQTAIFINGRKRAKTMVISYAMCDDDLANVCVLFNIWSMNGRSIGFTTIHSQMSSSIEEVYLKMKTIKLMDESSKFKNSF